MLQSHKPGNVELKTGREIKQNLESGVVECETSGSVLKVRKLMLKGKEKEIEEALFFVMNT